MVRAVQHGPAKLPSGRNGHQADEFVVATFNIRNGLAFDGLNSWPLRRRTTAKALAGLYADVLGLQEVYWFQRRYLLRRNGQYKAVGRGRRNGRAGEQCPILVRQPIELLSDATRWFGDRPDHPGIRLPGASAPRVATIARCRHGKSGREFDVVNVHLDEHVEPNRVRSAELLAEWLDDARPTVLLGDFNTTDGDRPVMDPLRDAGFETVPLDRGTNHDFTGTTDGPRLDHIFVRSVPSTRWEVVSSGVWAERTGRRLPSDHWPAVARVRLTDA